MKEFVILSFNRELACSKTPRLGTAWARSNIHFIKIFREAQNEAKPISKIITINCPNHRPT